MKRRAPRKTSLMKLIELQHGKPIEELLRELYWTRRMSMDEVGRELGINQGTVSKWMERFDILARNSGPRPRVCHQDPSPVAAAAGSKR